MGRELVAEMRKKRNAAKRAAAKRFAAAKKQLMRHERQARAERERWAGVVRMYRASRRALARKNPASVASVLAAERALELAEIEHRRALAAWALLHPRSAAAAKKGGRRTAEKRAEWLDRAAYDLPDGEKRLLSSLARSKWKNGKRWIDSVSPDRGRELFEEWKEENPDELIAAQAVDVSDVELAVQQAAADAEHYGVEWTAADERAFRASLRRLRRKKTMENDEVPF